MRIATMKLCGIGGLSTVLVAGIASSADLAPRDLGLTLRTQHVQSFYKEHPGVALSHRAGRVTRVYGTAFSIGDTPVESAAAFVGEHSGIFGVQAADLVPVGPFADLRHTTPIMFDDDTGEYRFTGVYFQQQHLGVSVYDGWLKLLVRNDPGYPLVLASADLRDLSGFVMPQIGAGGMNDGVIESVIGRAAEVSELDGVPQILDSRQVIFAGVNEDAITPRLAEEVLVGIDMDRWTIIADARTGEVLHEVHEIYFIDIAGTVNGNATDGDGGEECGAEVSTPMPYLQVTAGANSVFADENGAFVIPNPGASPINVSAGMTGQWFFVNNIAGPLTSESVTVSPPGPANLLYNQPNTDGQVRAQVNGYIGANVVRDAVIAANPGYPGTGGGFPVNVNITGGLCPGNAWYDGGSINFCLPGGGAVNTAFGSVIFHEYGHHVVSAGGSGQGAYGEGMGDVMSVIILDNPELGIGFGGGCNPGIRNADNIMQWPCSGEIHFCGQLISGCVWSVRNELIVTEPLDYTSILGDLAVNAVLVHNGSNIDPDISIDWLTLDDDDADLGNGTPHFAEIASGFSDHNMFDADISFVFPSGLPDLVNPGGGTTVQVNVSALSATPASGTGMFHIDTGGGFATFPMSEGPTNQYVATFPATTCGTAISYYFSVESTTGIEFTAPDGAPAANFSVVSAAGLNVTFADDFESNLGWTVSSTALDGGWTRGVPIPNSTCNRGNPGADGDGSGQAFVTDNSSANQCNSDVDDGQTILTSPIMDASGGEDYFINYMRWFHNTFGASPNQDTFLVEVSDNGGTTWTNLETVGPVNQANGGWFSLSFRVADFVNLTSQFRIRFIAQDTDPQSVVEAGVDAVELSSVQCGPGCPWDCATGVGQPDGSVNIVDLLALLADWGVAGSCDFDGNGLIDIVDLLDLLANWGPCP